MSAKLKLIETLDSIKADAIKNEAYELAQDLTDEIALLNKLSNINIDDKDVEHIMKYFTPKERVEVYYAINKGWRYPLDSRVLKNEFGFVHFGQLGVNDEGELYIKPTHINEVEDPLKILNDAKYTDNQDENDETYMRQYARINASMLGLNEDDLYNELKAKVQKEKSKNAAKDTQDLFKYLDDLKKKEIEKEKRLKASLPKLEKNEVTNDSSNIEESDDSLDTLSSKSGLSKNTINYIATGVLCTLLFGVTVVFWVLGYYLWNPIIYISFVPNILILITKAKDINKDKEKIQFNVGWTKSIAVVLSLMTILMLL